jgi:hypothetical protein
VATTDRNDKQLQKEPDAAREAHDEVQDNIRSGAVKPLEPNINRDRARGDWDRTRQHNDETEGGS